MNSLRLSSFQNIINNPSSFSIRGLIDLSLLTKKRVALSVSQNQYIDLLASFGLILNQKNIILLGDERIQEESPVGICSIYSRLMSRLSLELYSNLKNITILLYVRDLSEFKYKKTIKRILINPKSSFTEVVDALIKTGYEEVAHVKDIKQFCIKGGLIDFYSPIYQNPIRAYFYEEPTSFIFYNLSTGLSKQGPLKEVYLNKEEKKVMSIGVDTLLKKQAFTKISSLYSSKKKINNQIKEVSESYINKHNGPILYLEDLQFSLYKQNNKLYAPYIYKNMENPHKEVVGSSFAFERGDYVCHEDFGVGQLTGFDTKGGFLEDFVKIKYLDGSVSLSVKKLFKLFFVSRETDFGGDVDSLNKKGSWKKRRSVIQKNAEKYVDNLVNIYTNKSVDTRPPFVFGGELEASFLKGFRYTDTKDQKLVWENLKKDLEGAFPMSRLLCGDVGFGKTELAIRAVFRVVINGGRAIVLCPTSILVNQHFGVFVDRLAPVGVSVSTLSGGLSLKKRNKIKVDWVERKIDVLISTSAALYDDVFIRFASFFVIDEEHRFGVKQKEVLFNKFVNKDVLFMSATPIPRTLHLSLSGIHNISTLSTPPFIRKPINTVVSFFSDQLIKQSIYFELSRNGQVFYLHNRINTISSVKSFLLKLCPVLKVGVVHSRLGAEKIKTVLLDFIDKKYNLLLCSSVIASGIDIPNANTIIIDNAHLFGLSQLHQIRGRVGRGSLYGFAYLLVPKEGKLTVASKKRLKTIEQNSSLGDGYSLSKSDLEIRGGGAVFGYKQSGAVFDVGYEFYSKIVSRCFDKTTNKTNISAIDAFNYKVSFLCCFDQSYIFLDYERLRAYRELSGLYLVETIKVFKERLTQVYGPLSKPGANLLYMRLASLLCASLNINNLTYNAGTLVLFFNNSFIGVDFLVKFLETYKTKFNVLRFVFNVENNKTNIVICFNSSLVVDGLFLRDFLRGFYVFYKK